MAELTVTIRNARALCKTLEARGILVIAVHGDRLSAASYGQTKKDCAEMGKHLDRAFDAIVKSRGPSGESALARACRHALTHLAGIGWPEDKKLVEELRAALDRALLLRPCDARGVESKGLEARCRGWEGLLPQVQASSKDSEALTYDGRAGKQREKNGARLTGGHA
jgi:hypothetical protein